MKFEVIANYRGSLSLSHLCRMMGVTDRGLRALRRRPPSHRPRRDMVILAHIRAQHRLSLVSQGRPRMTEELNELGLRVGQRRVGRLMRQNGICIVRSRKFKRTTDSDHDFNIAPNLLQQDFTASGPDQKWAGDITDVWTREGWVYLAIIIDCRWKISLPDCFLILLHLTARDRLGHELSHEAGPGDQGAGCVSACKVDPLRRGIGVQF